MRVIICAVVGLFILSVAHAKDVELEWKEIKGAVRYQLMIERNGKTVVNKQLEKNAWAGDLPFGFYSYQLRAFDKVQRPGSWSTARALVVMPESPKPTHPLSGETQAMYSPSAVSRFAWRPVSGVGKYHFILRANGSVVREETVSATQIEIKGLAKGKYDWSVMAVVEPSGRNPAFQGKSWKSTPSVVDSFTIDQRVLEKPEPVFPIGSVQPSSDRRIKFKWKRVDGAEAYEFKIYRKPAAQDAAPATAKVVRVTEPEFTGIVPEKVDYVWQVRALANIDSSKNVGAEGPQATVQTRIDPNASFVDGSGYIALSTMVAPYTYVISSPLTGVEGKFNSSALTLRATGEYWLSAHWGLAAGLERTQITVLGNSVSRMGFDATAKYRINLSSSRHGWVLMPKAGFEYRDYPEVRPYSVDRQEFTLYSPKTFGALLGFDLRKQFSDAFSIGARFAFYQPLILSGVDGSLAGGVNMNFGLQGLYWLSKQWGLGGGGFFDLRALKYTPDGGSLNQEISMNGTYFFGSIIFSFGR